MFIQRIISNFSNIENYFTYLSKLSTVVMMMLICFSSSTVYADICNFKYNLFSFNIISIIIFMIIIMICLNKVLHYLIKKNGDKIYMNITIFLVTYFIFVFLYDKPEHHHFWAITPILPFIKMLIWKGISRNKKKIKIIIIVILVSGFFIDYSKVLSLKNIRYFPLNHKAYGIMVDKLITENKNKLIIFSDQEIGNIEYYSKYKIKPIYVEFFILGDDNMLNQLTTLIKAFPDYYYFITKVPEKNKKLHFMELDYYLRLNKNFLEACKRNGFEKVITWEMPWNDPDFSYRIYELRPISYP